MKDLVAGYVYVLERADGYVKIGKSVDAQKRLNEIETISGLKSGRTWVSQPCGNYSEIEKECHKKLFQKRGIGEYFHVSFDDAVNLIGLFEFKTFDHIHLRECTVIAARIPRTVHLMCQEEAHSLGMNMSTWIYSIIMDPLNYDEGEKYPFADLQGASS